MEKRSSLVLRVLINRYHPQDADQIFTYLSKKDREAMRTQDLSSNDLTPIFQHDLTTIQRMHYSWIKPIIDNLSPTEQTLSIAALTAVQQQGLQSPPAFKLSQPIKSFIIHKLASNFKKENEIPIEYLPKTKLSPLIKWNKRQLVDLIDYLGLHDLAIQVRQIVNRQHLNNIYNCLTPRQLQYLKTLHQKEKIVSTKLHLDPSNIDEKQLKQLLHRRGLARLGLALCGQHPDFVWTIAHCLDIGRGKILLKDFKTEPLPEITAVFQDHVLTIMNFLKKSKS